MDDLFAFILVGIFIITPPVVSIYNFIGLFHRFRNKVARNIIWAVTAIVGVLETVLNLEFLCDVSFEKSWTEQLYNEMLHQPIWTDSYPTLIILCTVGVIGFIILAGTDSAKVPPLVTVLSMAATYILLGFMIVCCIQISNHAFEKFIALSYILPINMIFITFNLFREKIMEWNGCELHNSDDFGKNVFIKKLNESLLRSEKWPLYAFILMIPLLGIVLLILILFGQQPDAVIKAFTETTNWALSGQEGPQNLYYDEHYLCTVAAGGHKKVVKPVRKGVRHGHDVIVNRQLMIANAFENVLEEKTPRFHRAVRNFYDKYGFPIADHIRHNKVACDVTYFVMKPLEWIFLIVLYLVDVNPENRIAVQYLPGIDRNQER